MPCGVGFTKLAKAILLEYFEAYRAHEIPPEPPPMMNRSYINFYFIINYSQINNQLNLFKLINSIVVTSIFRILFI